MTLPPSYTSSIAPSLRLPSPSRLFQMFCQLSLPHHHQYQLPPHHLYRVSQKKFLSQFLDFAVIMGACLTPPSNPARVSSQLANEVLGPAFQKVIIFGIPSIMIILFRSPESLLFLYFLSCEAAFFLLVTRSRYRLGEYNHNDNGDLYVMLISLYITKIPYFC